MKKYKQPSMEVVKFEIYDVVTLSGTSDTVLDDSNSIPDGQGTSTSGKW